jgi:hypothetical protein
VRRTLNASFVAPSALQSSLTLVSLAPRVNSTAVAAAGANISSLLVNPATNVTIGSRVYLLLTLRSAANRTVLQSAGVQVNVTGEEDVAACCRPSGQGKCSTAATMERGHRACRYMGVLAI